MAAAVKSDAGETSPMFAGFGVWFAGLDAISQAYQPLLKGLAHTQLELFGLMSRRAQAYAQLPALVCQCQNPQALVTEQLRFWQTAFEQYASSGRRIAASMDSLVAASPLISIPGGAEKERSMRPHDYITFVEPEQSQRPAHPQRDRKVA